MDDSSGLLQIPAEIIEIILSQRCLVNHDICHVASCCSVLRELCNNNELWRIKLKQRWPDLYRDYSDNGGFSWKEEYRLQLQCSATVHRNLASMSRSYFQKADIPETGYTELCSMLQQHPRAHSYVTNALRQLIHDDKQHKNMTNKYYAKKAVQFVQQEHLKTAWHHYLEQPPHKQSLEMGFIMVAQWFQTSQIISVNKIRQQLDELAGQVKSQMKVKCPHISMDHMFEGGDVRSVSAKDSRVVLETVNNVLFEDCGFCGNEDDYYNSDNSYINQVLLTRKGIPISLSLLYIAVAGRLGVTCEPVNFPAHFLIKWKEHPELGGSEQYTYIDVFSGGKFLSQPECSSIITLPVPAFGDSPIYQTIQPAQVFERFARNLINIGRQHTSRRQSEEGVGFLQQAIEFLSTIKPDDIENEIFRVRLYLYMGVNIKKAQDILELLETRVNTNAFWGNMHQVHSLQDMVQSHIEEEQSNQSNTIVAKKRTENGSLAYSVGLIMQHTRYDYACVIYGWDQRCTATDEWVLQMGVNLLPKKQHQPFYNVLVEDGSNRYAAEENLEPHPNPEVLPHPDIGKYFEEFCDTYYKPNREKCEQYPEDPEHTITLVHERYTDKNPEET